MSTYFMRHGETLSAADSKNMSVKEATEKISLSETGRKQMRNVQIPNDIDVIVISDSRRTKESAQIILNSNKRTIPVIVESELYPWDSGADDWDSYWKRYYEFVTNYNPKGPYESKDSMKKRVGNVLSKYQNKNILVIAHSVLLATYMGDDFLPYASIFRID